MQIVSKKEKKVVIDSLWTICSTKFARIGKSNITPSKVLRSNNLCSGPVVQFSWYLMPQNKSSMRETGGGGEPLLVTGNDKQVIIRFLLFLIGGKIVYGLFQILHSFIDKCPSFFKRYTHFF